MPRPMGAVRRVPMASRLVYLTMCLAACALAVSCVSLRDNPTTCESDADCAGGRCYRGFCLEGTRDAGSDGGAADARMDAFDLDAATADAPTADAPTADASVDAHAAMDVFAADTPTPLDAGADAPTCSGAGVDCTYPMPGRCAAGVTHCTPRGSVVCGRRDDPVPELCNREDDDCDGAVDENADEPCFSGAVGCTVSGSGYECVGVCQPGVLRCNDGVPGVVCEGERLPASATDGCTPDGMQASDDDCDGDIDEDCTCTADVDCYPGPLSTQGVGACRAGTAVCSSGRLGACMGAQVPMPESCPDNRTDDDCNGAVDDVPGAGVPCDTGLEGICADGTMECGESAIGCAGPGPQSEECNGLDDDCNGSVDEGFDLSVDERNCGACGRACGAGLECCDGVCLSTAGDPTHCGSCTTRCSGATPACCGSTCRAATAAECTGCPTDCSLAGQQCCENGHLCVDGSSDPAHCGANAANPCGVVCAAGQRCCDGACVGNSDAHCGSCGACSGTEQCCGTGTSATCIADLDPNNCLGCGTRCASGTTCCATGGCANLQTAFANCGSCGRSCGPGEHCTNGACCGTGLTSCGGACVNTSTDRANCGTCGTDCRVLLGVLGRCSGGSCTL
jgi:hypothetical protein